MSGGDDELYHPLNVPKPLGPNIWVVDGPAVSFYGMPFPTRMVVLRVSGGLWVHSPIAPDEALMATLADLGPVRWLIAPNPLHYLHIGQWAKRFPEAQVWAAPGVAARSAHHGLDFPVHHVLSDTAPADWALLIRQKLIPGHDLLQEVVFFHEATKSLILTDLIENFEPGKLGRFMKVATWIGGVRAPHGGTPRDAKLTWRDKPAAAAAIREVIGWSPERVIMAHGKIIEDDAVTELKRAFAWLV